MLIVSTSQRCSAPGDFTGNRWISAGHIAVGVFDGELLLLRLPLQAHNMAVSEPGPDGPGYT